MAQGTDRGLSRRSFLQGTAAGVVLLGTPQVLLTAPNAAASSGHTGLRPARRPTRPACSRCPPASATGSSPRPGRPRWSPGEPTPSNHDGTGRLRAAARGTTLLVNNHEIDAAEAQADWEHPGAALPGPRLRPGARPAAAPSSRSTATAPGRRVGRHRRHLHQLRGRHHPVGHLADLRGDRGPGRRERHAPRTTATSSRSTRSTARQPRPEPLKALGRYAHEAVVVDPQTGHALPHRGRLRPQRPVLPLDPAGRLPRRRPRRSCASLGGDRRRAPGHELLRRRQARRRPVPRRPRSARCYGVDWVDVPDRDAAAPSVRKQFGDGEVTRGRKLEGMWWGDGGAYVVSSYARARPARRQHDGQVWFYDPKRRTLTLKVLLRRQPDPSTRRRLRRPGQHHRLAVRRADPRRGRRGRAAPVRRHRARRDLPDGPQRGRTSSEFTGPVFSPDGDPVRQHADARDHVRDHRAVAAPALTPAWSTAMSTDRGDIPDTTRARPVDLGRWAS